jgi:hypothetical protein
MEEARTGAVADAMAEVKAMLRICARNLYGWDCDHAELGMRAPYWTHGMSGTPTPRVGRASARMARPK